MPTPADSEGRSDAAATRSETTVSPDLLGQQIAPYRLVDVLGTGGMADVYLGRHVTSGHTVAVKVARTHDRDPDCTQRINEHFAREAEVLALLEHCSHIVSLLASGELGARRPYLVMEWIDGQDLQHEIEARGPLGLREAANILTQICAGLQAAHDLGITHLDLKPQNIMVQRARPRKIVLVDFGIAKQQERHSRRQPGWIEGSPLFMAPEQLTGSEGQLGPAADIYAIGLLCYLLLSGKLPFDIEARWSVGELLHSRLASDPVPLAARRPQLPPDLYVLVDGCLAVAPTARPRSAAAFARAFQQIAARSVDRSGQETLLGLGLALATTLSSAANKSTGVNATGALCQA